MLRPTSISPISRLYLAYISPISRTMADVTADLDREVAADRAGQRRLIRVRVRVRVRVRARARVRVRARVRQGLRACGLVSPSIILPTLTAFVPSHTMHVTGPDIMYSRSDGKKGFSTRSP